MRVLQPGQYPVSLSSQCREPASSCPHQKAVQLDRSTQLHSLTHGRFCLELAVFPFSRLTGLSLVPAPVDRLPLSTLELGNGFRSCLPIYLFIYSCYFSTFSHWRALRETGLDLLNVKWRISVVFFVAVMQIKPLTWIECRFMVNLICQHCGNGFGQIKERKRG